MMTSKVFGGTLSIIGALFILSTLSISIFSQVAYFSALGMFLNFIIALGALIGGYKGMRGENLWSFITVSAGSAVLLLGILFYINPQLFLNFAPYSYFLIYLNLDIPFITIEALLILTGGIVSKASTSSKQS